MHQYRLQYGQYHYFLPSEYRFNLISPWHNGLWQFILTLLLFIIDQRRGSLYSVDTAESFRGQTTLRGIARRSIIPLKRLSKKMSHQAFLSSETGQATSTDILTKMVFKSLITKLTRKLKYQNPKSLQSSKREHGNRWIEVKRRAQLPKS